MDNTLANFREEFSSKLPALTLLSNLGYTFIAPTQCDALRGNPFLGEKAPGEKSTGQVVLRPIMRAFLAKQTFPFAGQQHPLSDAAIDKIMHELNPAMNEGLNGANEKLYNAMLYGVSVTEFVEGKRASPTIQLIDWQQLENNQFHVTEEMVIQNSEGTGKQTIFS